MMNKISKQLEEAIQLQIQLEGNASQAYLAMAYWCDDAGLEGCKQYFLRQSDEERMHMLKFYEYLSEANIAPVTPQLNQPNREFGSVKELFEKVLDQEINVTKSINNLVGIAHSDNDYSSFEFLQWFVMEQREEEATVQSILDMIKLIGDGPQHLYYIDKEVSAINSTIA